MNITFTIDPEIKFYKYSDYQIKQIEEKPYIFPKEDAMLEEVNVCDNIHEIIIDLLKVGKCSYYNESNAEELAINFVEQNGFFGFLNDFPINPLFILDKDIVLKENNLLEDNYFKLGTISYVRKFMPNLLNQDILDKMEECAENIKDNRISESFKVIYNMSFVYSHDYGEPVEMILKYAKGLYEDLLNFQESGENRLYISSIKANFNVIDNIVVLESNTLKNAIDVCFIAEKMAEFRKLKICKYCKEPFIAKNAKSEYDSIKCKNKENVYKFRRKNNY